MYFMCILRTLVVPCSVNFPVVPHQSTAHARWVKVDPVLLVKVVNREPGSLQIQGLVRARPWMFRDGS